ncbi:hypothetical protein SCUP515_11240 [Seiridium cupressi]
MDKCMGTALDLSTAESLNRYVPGPVVTISQTMDLDEEGFLMVGADGVMRSFANDGTVMDFHQLDQDQLKEFAEIQLHGWENSKLDVPEEVKNLAKEPYPDGRLVLDKTELLNPEGMPKARSDITSRSLGHEIMEILKADKRQDCVGKPCITFNTFHSVMVSVKEGPIDTYKALRRFSMLLLAGIAFGDAVKSTDRYIAGAFDTVSGGMVRDIYGGKQVGEDGVLRSFANNGTVIDYHQLDPEQVEEFAQDQLIQWKASGQEVPESVVKLAQPPYPDGRLVVSVDDLLHPAEKPEFPPESEISKGTSTSPADPTRIIERQPLQCVGQPCQAVATCVNNFITRCSECYFPRGPPNGQCRT